MEILCLVQKGSLQSSRFWRRFEAALQGGESMDNKVEICYCTQCRWLLRAAWMAQELLTTFEQEISELTLRPAVGGVFEVLANGKRIWSRKEMGRFPELTELKQLLRDQIAPDKYLGHAERKGSMDS